MLIEKAQQFYGTLERLGKRKERILVWSFFVLLVFGVLLLTGTITSGFHLVDDWEFAKFVKMMSIDDKSYLTCLRETIAFDKFLRRFRPLYYINRIGAAAVFGINLPAISIIKGIEIVIALGALYYCARRLGCNIVYSMLFALTVMVGYQSAVWWKLGPQESFGMVLFAVGFYLLLTWLESGHKWRAVCSLLLFFLMTVYKESFVLLIPFIMLYILYEQMKEKKVTISALWESIKHRFPYLFTLGVILVSELLILVFVSGSNQYFSSGSGSTMSYEEYKSIWLNALGADLKWYVRFGIPLGMILLTYWEQLKKYGWQIVLAFAVVLPQVVSYSSGGIGERYILPAVFGFAFLFVIVGCNLNALSGKRRIVYMLCLLLMLAAHGRVVLYEANYFTYRGNGIQTMLETTLAYVEEHKDAKVLSCLGPNIEGNRTMRYWMRIHGYKDMLYWDEDTAFISRKYRGDGAQPTDDDVLDNIDVVIMYNREDRHWCYEPSLDLTDFTEYKCNTITMYIRE